MAAADPAKNIKDEATCSICSDLFKDPVTTECGHSFCRECIAQLCKEKEIDLVCPQCRQRFQKSNLRPNRELKNIVDSISQLLSSERLRNPIEENMCETHQEPLKLYCKEDQTPVCMVCERSQAHRAHTVVPMEEAVQEYWETITEQLEVIESTYKKLHLLVNKDWKRRPQSAGEKAHEKLKRLTDDVGILLKENIKGPRQRFEDLPSQTQPPEPDLKHFRPGKKIAVETELQGHKERENTRERVAEKQETASHVIHICEEAPTPKYGLDHRSLDPTIHNISNTTEDIHHKVHVEDLKQRFEGHVSLNRAADSRLKKVHVEDLKQRFEGHVSLNRAADSRLKKVDVAGLRQRFEVSTSPKESLGFGLRSGKHVSPAGQTRTVRVGSKENRTLERENAGEKASEKQNRASNHVGEETQTPKHAINRAYRDMTPPTANPTVEEDEGVQ